MKSINAPAFIRGFTVSKNSVQFLEKKIFKGFVLNYICSNCFLAITSQIMQVAPPFEKF